MVGGGAAGVGCWPTAAEHARPGVCRGRVGRPAAAGDAERRGGLARPARRPGCDARRGPGAVGRPAATAGQSGGGRRGAAGRRVASGHAVVAGPHGRSRRGRAVLGATGSGICAVPGGAAADHAPPAGAVAGDRWGAAGVGGDHHGGGRGGGAGPRRLGPLPCRAFLAAAQRCRSGRRRAAGHDHVGAAGRGRGRHAAGGSPGRPVDVRPGADGAADIAGLAGFANAERPLALPPAAAVAGGGRSGAVLAAGRAAAAVLGPGPGRRGDGADLALAPGLAAPRRTLGPNHHQQAHRLAAQERRRHGGAAAAAGRRGVAVWPGAGRRRPGAADGPAAAARGGRQPDGPGDTRAAQAAGRPGAAVAGAARRGAARRPLHRPGSGRDRAVPGGVRRPEFRR